jgi:hypothetical protein
MAKNLTTTGGKGAGLSTSRPASLGFHRNGLTLEMGEAKIFEDRVPTEAQKAILLARANDLRAGLEPSVSAGSSRALLLMLTMPSQSGDTSDMKLRGEAYRIAIEDLPAWAVEQAAKRFIRGDTPHPKTFAPSTAIFRDFVLSLLVGLREELDLIQDILRAKVIPAPPDLYRLPRPGILKWSDIKPEERVGHDPEPPIGKHITDDFMDDLKARMARRAATTEGENA